MAHNMKKHSFAMNCSRDGFTLLELSIVMAIIGLIIGGIVVGQDLIMAARINSQLNQLEQLKSGTQAFQYKYNALPGDISYDHATQYGFASPPNFPKPSIGNEDGFIDGTWANTLENYYFFYHLAQTDFITCSNGCNPNNWFLGYGSQAWDQMALPAAIGGNTFVHIYGGPNPGGFGAGATISMYGGNYFEITSSATANGNTARPFTPQQANSIDSKIDDGFPLTGTVIATGKWAQLTLDNWWTPHAASTGAAGTGNCVSTSSTPNVYNVQNGNYLCGLQFDAGF